MADRVGVINGGKILLVEEKTALMHKLGKRRLTLTAQPMTALPPSLANWPLALEDGGNRLAYAFECRGRAGFRPAAPARRDRRRFQGPRNQPNRSRTFSSAWWGARRERSAINLRASGRSTAPRWRARGAPSGRAWRRLSSRRRSISSCSAARSARASSRSSGVELRRLHRAGPDHAVAADAEHLERLDRDLLPQIHRHDLRDLVGAAVRDRDGLRLCRRGGDQIGGDRPHHSG